MKRNVWYLPFLTRQLLYACKVEARIGQSSSTAVCLAAISGDRESVQDRWQGLDLGWAGLEGEGEGRTGGAGAGGEEEWSGGEWSRE